MIPITQADMDLLNSIPQTCVRRAEHCTGFDRLAPSDQATLRARLPAWGLETRVSGHIVDIRTEKMVARGYADLVYRRAEIFTWLMVQPPLEHRHMAGFGNDVDCMSLIREALGDAVDAPHSGMIAFAYLWRRFGPPLRGCDPHKDLCGYYLTTADPEIWICLRVSGMPLSYAASFLVSPKIRSAVEAEGDAWNAEFNRYCREVYGSWDAYIDIAIGEDREAAKQASDKLEATIGECPRLPRNWRISPNDAHRHLNQTVLDAYRELLRPVPVRDIYINIFGRVPDDAVVDPVEPSVYAGYGISLDAIKLDKETDQ